MDHHEINITASSDTRVGAENVSADGSAFDMTLSNAIRIPLRARNTRLSVSKAAVWFSTPNVTTGNNDTIVILDRRARLNTDTVELFGDGRFQPPAFAQEYPVVTPSRPEPESELWIRYEIRLLQGLYSSGNIDSFVKNQVVSQSGVNDNLIDISGNSSFDRVEIKTRRDHISIDLTGPRSIAPLLGFEPRILTGANGGTLFIADRRVDLSPTEFYLIQCSLVDDGMRIANRQSQIISKIPINVGVGQLVSYEPRRPPMLPCEGMRTQPIRNIRFTLLKSDLTPADTNGNSWSVDIKIQYSLPIH
jgi:hypothetical protein